MQHRDDIQPNGSRPTWRQPPISDQEEVDVLIVGSGPAGLVLAAQLAQFPGIKTRVVERRGGPLELGQADGVACRTVEMFDAFRLSDRLLREGYWVNEVTFWGPAADDLTRIVRTGRVRDSEDDLSEFPHVTLNQARVQSFLLEAMERSPSRLVPDYGVSFEALEVLAEGDHPVRVHLLRDGRPLTVQARYAVGCDGAHSRVRESLGLTLDGDAANHAWGVMDVLMVTDFPDVRLKSAIQSEESGSILLIPREGGDLVRLYVDLGEVTEANRDQTLGMSVEEVVAVAARVLRPYVIDVKLVVWFAIYEVAQRLTDAFDDAAGRGDLGPRVFIAGDACHTHSAKAGQGMNVSMQDAFNLGWKLAAVLEERSAPGLLNSYSAEREPIARELIDFDREWAAMLATRPKDAEADGAGGTDPAEVERYYVRQGRYTAGVATHYGPSALTVAHADQRLAGGFEIGTRFHSAPVIRVADAKPMQLGHVALADGRWRLYVFADSAGSALRAFCEWLLEDADSPVRRYTPLGADVDAVFDVRAILQTAHRDVVLEELPAILRPRKGEFGLTDYEKVFSADPWPGRDIFEMRRVDRAAGCCVVVRPDQYIATVLALDASDELAAFFAALLLTPVAGRR